MRLHFLLLLTSTAANISQRSGGGSVGSSRAKMPKTKATGKNHKKHAGARHKKPRHKPAEPAGGWPDVDKVVAELEQKAQSTYGVNLRDVYCRWTSSPGTWVKAKRDNCTLEMVKTCAAYVMVMCFSQEMVDTSIHNESSLDNSEATRRLSAPRWRTSTTTGTRSARKL